ncbi:MAG: hypothetical protein QM779_14910 [Propionicimonas sp.]|uniref:hypothetical protein n=1 Tax=Propionicimonas sp. TaxID=1955623 RepID=UPI003D0CA985
MSETTSWEELRDQRLAQMSATERAEYNAAARKAESQLRHSEDRDRRRNARRAGR